jgi:hypothetical protein
VCAITFPIGEVDANSSADPAPMVIAFDGPTGGEDDTESLRRALGAAWETIATQAATAAQPAATPLEPIGAVAISPRLLSEITECGSKCSGRNSLHARARARRVKTQLAHADEGGSDMFT